MGIIDSFHPAADSAPSKPSRSPAALWRKLATGRSPWGLADQVLISGANFVTMVFAGRGLGEAGFGEFSLVYNALLFANILQMSLITQPHNVLGNARGEKSAYASYTTSTAITQGVMAAILAILALGWVGVAHVRGWHCEGLLLALVPAIVAWQLQEFFRRILYTEGRTAAAFANDVISYGGQAVWILALFWMDRGKPMSVPHHLTGAAALYVLAITSALGALLGAYQIRHSLRGRFAMSAWTDNWHFGKWLVASEILTYFSALPMYMNLVGWLVGKAAAGELKAAQTLFGPTRVISFYLATVLPIQFARQLTQGGNGALHQQMKSTARVVLPVLAFFCLLIALFAGPLLTLFGRDFAAHPRVLALYAVVAFLAYVQMVLAAALTAKRQTLHIFLGSIGGAVITVTMSWGLIKWLSIDGALVAMILTGLVMTVLFWVGYRRSMGEDVLPAIDAVASIAPSTQAITNPPSEFAVAGGST